MELFAKGRRLEHDGIAIFEVDSSEVIISLRAYYFFPQACYSLGIVRSAKGATITAMRNPWRDFPSVPLGEIFSKFGGGGHQRIAALVLTEERAAEAGLILDQIKREIRKEEVGGL